MKELLLSILRDKKTGQAQFRDAAEKLGFLLAAEIAIYLKKASIRVVTPIGTTQGIQLNGRLIVVPILRSGLGLLSSFLKYYPDAQVGMIGLKRDEETILPSFYYINLPDIDSDAMIILLEPMIATGKTVLEAIDCLQSHGASLENIVVASLIAAPEGVEFVRKKAPQVKLHISQWDEQLNDRKFIVPGLGDFGDRYFGTINNK